MVSPEIYWAALFVLYLIGIALMASDQSDAKPAVKWAWCAAWPLLFLVVIAVQIAGLLVFFLDYRIVWKRR